MRHFLAGEREAQPSALPALGDPGAPDADLPVPQDEQNNPNFAACTNRNA